jgi:hypothetical protein
VIAGALVIVYGAKYLFALYKTNDVSY